MQWRDPVDKRNFYFMTANGALYFTALAFIDGTIVVPLFLNQLTQSPVLVGLASTVRTVGFFLPQILMAGWVTGATRLNRFIFRLHLTTRLPLFLPALAVWFDAPPALVALLFLSAYTLFAFGEGIAQVPWMDVFGRTIDDSHRGKLFGTMQALGGLGALAGTLVVQRVFASPRLTFPDNFALLIAIGAACMFLSTIMIRLAVDPPKTKEEARQLSVAHVLRRIPQYLTEDRRFSRMLLVQVLTSFNVLGFPFYILFIQQAGVLPPWAPGFLLSLQVLGQVSGGLLLGYLSDRVGNRRTIMSVTAINIAVPLFIVFSQQLAGMAAFAGTGLGFMFLGACFGGWLGFVNYLMEITPAEKRPVYVSLSNLFSAPVALLPITAGAFLRLVPMQWIFWVVAAIEAAALLLAYRLPEPRESRGAGTLDAVGKVGLAGAKRTVQGALGERAPTPAYPPEEGKE
ncbi:transporter, major facilitator family [Heliomicrobium modesticaldum Ice1]|uniref:Transporter, major facilitator family n=1 Tax=Heliobacterium modesticaldum (strain ATCC 51547 / Ice1) TaxID=498761 RepID=B0TEZ7_HELMI|nr:MFS transporter [Heliomicrobium modesticaldum]ABZ82980.1 transporter, major facilitator family [Heliomicrobium modesticaldum Ice1]